MKKNIRILFGAVDVGWRIDLYSRFIQNKLPHFTSTSFVKYQVDSSQYKTKYDYAIHYKNFPSFVQWLISFLFLLYLTFTHDIIHLFSGENLLTRKTRRLEFILYKALGKRLILHFVGSDIRNPAYIKWLNSSSPGKPAPPLSTNWQNKLIADSLKYADYILVSTPDLKKIIPQAHYYPVVLDHERFLQESEKYGFSEKKYEQKDKITILHAPSNIAMKGTGLLTPILKKYAEQNTAIELILTSEFNRETNSVYTVSRYELFELYYRADIVIDQMLIGWYGLQSIEALLTRNVVINHIDPSLEMYRFPDCPILSTDFDHLTQTLDRAVHMVRNNNIDWKAQTDWVKKYHSISSNHSPLLIAWNEM